MYPGLARKGRAVAPRGGRYTSDAVSVPPYSAAIDQIRRIIVKIRAESSHPVRGDLDQCPATPATVLRRLTLLAQPPEARTAAILLIGDDDLLSVALAVGQIRSRIAVLDADRALLRLIARHAGSAVEVIRADVRRGLPPALHHRFDQVFTDPPYTLAGQLLFVQRAMLALKSCAGGSLHLCASRVYLSAQDISRVRLFLRSGGFELQATHPRFNRYRAPEDVQHDLERQGHTCTTWLESDLFHYVRSQTGAVPALPKNIIGKIYTY